jgi:hypothetical protein
MKKKELVGVHLSLSLSLLISTDTIEGVLRQYRAKWFLQDELSKTSTCYFQIKAC